MRSEHKTTDDEFDAFTGWRHLYNWRPGHRKALKLQSHRKDRRKAKQQIEKEK